MAFEIDTCACGVRVGVSAKYPLWGREMVVEAGGCNGSENKFTNGFDMNFIFCPRFGGWVPWLGRMCRVSFEKYRFSVFSCVLKGVYYLSGFHRHLVY